MGYIKALEDAFILIYRVYEILGCIAEGKRIRVSSGCESAELKIQRWSWIRMWACYTQQGPLKRKGGRWLEEGEARREGRQTTLLALQMEEGATNQGMLEASRSWKGKEVECPIRNTVVPTPWS